MAREQWRAVQYCKREHYYSYDVCDSRYVVYKKGDLYAEVGYYETHYEASIAVPTEAASVYVYGQGPSIKDALKDACANYRALFHAMKATVKYARYQQNRLV